MVQSKRYLAAAILILGALAVLVPFIHSVQSDSRSTSASTEVSGRFIMSDQPLDPSKPDVLRTEDGLHLVADH